MSVTMGLCYGHQRCHSDRRSGREVGRRGEEDLRVAENGMKWLLYTLSRLARARDMSACSLACVRARLREDYGASSSSAFPATRLL